MRLYMHEKKSPPEPASSHIMMHCTLHNYLLIDEYKLLILEHKIPFFRFLILQFKIIHSQRLLKVCFKNVTRSGSYPLMSLISQKHDPRIALQFRFGEVNEGKAIEFQFSILNSDYTFSRGNERIT